jgi:hypothetical protein
MSVALVQMRDPAAFSQEMLRLQNAPRAALGLQPLHWDEKLASEARGYAEKLASNGRFEHSHAPGVGENLWMGTALAFTYEDMVDSWISERRLYRSGTIPNVSLSGNWADVGHYTQIVWRSTTSVGCGLASGRRNEVLVCRYWPAGNVLGQWAYERPNPIAPRRVTRLR